MLRKRGRLVVLGVVLAGSTAGGWYWWGRAGETAMPLTTATVSRGAVVETVNATGTLQAVTTVQVGTQVSGTIKALHADFNSRVTQGQVVAELEPSLFQSQVEQARASLVRLESEVERARVQLDDANTKLKRAEALSAQQLIAATDLDTARTTAAAAAAAVKSADAQVVQARASLTQAEVNLDHTIIRAPIDGVVISRSVDVGQTVAASMQAPTIFVIAKDLGEMQVNASIDEADIGRIQAGQRVMFRVDAFPGRTFTGDVVQVRLEPVVEQNVVSYITVIRVPNPELQLKPGMTASVSVEVARDDDTLRVPTAALRFRPAEDVLARFGDSARAPVDADSQARSDARPARAEVGESPRTRAAGAHVWVFDGLRIHEVPVEAGVSDGASTSISGDLSEGELVVVGVAAGTPSAQTARTTSPLIPARPARGAGAGRQGGGQ